MSLAGVSQHQFVAGVSVVAKGPVLLNTETDANGNYHFVEVPPGEYAVSATFSGSEATQRLEVEPNRTVQLNLQIKLVTATTVMVQADNADSSVASPAGTITEKTIRDAPTFSAVGKPGSDVAFDRPTDSRYCKHG